MKQKDYELQKLTEQVRSLLEEMSLQGIPLSEGMGELMTLASLFDGLCELFTGDSQIYNIGFLDAKFK